MPRYDKPILPQRAFQVDAGQRLRRLLELLNMKQTEAAELMGVTKHVLRNWLAGDNPVQPYPLYRLCKLKGLDFNFVYLGDWSHLPHHLSKALEDEAIARLAAQQERAHQEADD